MHNRRIRVKFCGMTNREDVQAAIALGADALGFILYPHSKRMLSIESVRPLLKLVPPFVARVVVLVNPSQSEVETIIKQLDIHYLQFHGHETAEFCEQFSIPYIKAVPASSTQHIEEAMQRHASASAILIDTPSPQYGGTGISFDWRLIPKTRTMPLILSGGLKVDTIRQAIEVTNPYAVDVCSGIEQGTGFKDHDKMKNFLNEVSQSSPNEFK